MAGHEQSAGIEGQFVQGGAVPHYWYDHTIGETVVTFEKDAIFKDRPSIDPATRPQTSPVYSTQAQNFVNSSTLPNSLNSRQSSLQNRAKPPGRIKTSIRLLLVLVDLITDVIFVVECYRPGTLGCLTYSAYPENEEKRQRLHRGIIYGAWACAAAAAIELAAFSALYYRKDKEPPPRLCSLINFLGGCHDSVQVIITFLFNWYLGAGSLVAAISMLVSSLMVLFHWVHVLHKSVQCTACCLCQCLCWGPVTYLLGVLVFFFVCGPFVPAALFGQNVTFVNQFNVTVQVSCTNGATGQPVTYDMLFMENYEWRPSLGHPFRNATNTTHVGPAGNLPGAFFNVTGRAFYWQTTEGWLNIFGSIGKYGPLYLAISNPIRNYSRSGGTDLVKDRGQRFITTLQMNRDGLTLQVIDLYHISYVPNVCGSGVYRDGLNGVCTEAAAYDFKLISDGNPLFQGRFPYELSGKTAYLNQRVEGDVPVLCPQVASEVQSYESLLEGGASVGFLNGFIVGLSMEGTYCRNARRTAAESYLNKAR